MQLAKAAIAAGIQLLDEAAWRYEKKIFKKVYIAGAFGNYMDPEECMRMIGTACLFLFWNIWVAPVGNAAGEGAKIALAELQMN